MSPDDDSDQHASDPQSWNLYSYVRNNPLKNTDPTGNACVNGKDDNSGGESCADVDKHNAEALQNGQYSATVAATANAWTDMASNVSWGVNYTLEQTVGRWLGSFDIASRTKSSSQFALAGIGLLVAFSPEERAIAEALEIEGATVERLAVIQGQKNADALVNGVTTEFKTVTVAGTNTLKNRIQDGLKQGTNVVVDVRGTSITRQQAMQQIQRVEGNLGSVQGRVTILTREGMVKH